jgi:hypothetical protein
MLNWLCGGLVKGFKRILGVEFILGANNIINDIFLLSVLFIL